jgi:ABC-type transporter Mla MlaB component
MNKFKYFVAILSPSFDGEIMSIQVDNSAKGIMQFVSTLTKKKVALTEVLICMEHTGLYGSIIVEELQKHSISIWVEMPYNIKHSMGIQRGKSDKVDAIIRIAEYAYRFQDKALIFNSSNLNLKTLKALLSIRDKLQKSVVGIKVHLNDLKRFDPSSFKLVKVSIESSIRKLNKEMQSIDGKIDVLVKQDSELNRVYKLATLVVGVGRYTVLYLMCATNLF